MAAMAAMLTSCSKDDGITEVTPVDSMVTFTVNAPELTTRAGEGNGKTATHLEYVIYDLAETAANGANQITGTAEFFNGELTTTVEVQLVEGREYEAIFFASAPGAPYRFNKVEQTMTVDYQTLLANQETYDAFYAFVGKFEIVDKNYSIDVDLTRPFAQLNVATNDHETQAGKLIDAEKTKVTVSNIYNTLNFRDGSVADDTAVTFDWAPRMDGSIEAAGAEYDWLSMNYILVEKVDKNALVGVKFEFTDNTTSGVQEYTRNYSNVPVNRNHRTNIIGSILTSPTDFNVEILPGFAADEMGQIDGENYFEVAVSNATELQDAINNAPAGQITVIKFANDITAGIDAGITIEQKQDVDIVIDGCGKKFDGQFLVNGKARSTGTEFLTFRKINFSTASDTKFTFISAPSRVDNKYNYSHNVSIEDCTFEYTGNAGIEIGSANFTGTYNLVMKNCKATNMHSILQAQSVDNTVLVDNVETINCKSGVSFGNTAYPTLRNAKIEAAEYGVRADGNASRGKLFIENSTIEAKQPVVVRKVTTAGYTVNVDEASVLATAEAYHVIFTKGSDDAAYVAPEVDFTFNGSSKYVVFPYVQNAVVVTTEAELTDAVKNAVAGDAVVVAEGTYGKFPSVGKNITLICHDVVFQGNSKLNIGGSTVVGATFSNPSGNAVDQTINGVFKECTFTGSNALRNAYVGETCVFENCVFDGSVYGIHFDGGTSKEVTFRNCTISGFNALAAAIGMATFEGCTFKSNGRSGYNGANLWGSAKLIDCEFTFNGSCGNEWIDFIGADKTYEVTNCTVNGVAYTAGNYTNFDEIFSRNHTTVKIDGVDCAM